MDVAIIGSGVSGLVAAHRLSRRARVTVYEAAPKPGGHVNTVEVETAAGPRAVDTGFIVFNDRNYPTFTRLLEELEVPSRRSEMSFSVSDGEFEYSSRSPNGLLARRANLVDPGFLRMIGEVPRFQRRLAELVGAGPEGPSLGEVFAEGGYSRQFGERLIGPQVAAVWSAEPGALADFPAGLLARFFANHGMLSLRGRPRWRTVEGGSQRYVEALLREFQGRLRLSSPVTRVERFEDRVEVTAAGAGPGNGAGTGAGAGPGTGAEPEAYDQVVIATHSDQALAMLADPDRLERQVLGAIEYRRSNAVLHTDRSLLPRRRRAWASWNYHLDPEQRGPVAITYLMNLLQGLDCEQELCVTLNREDRIDPARVISRLEYEHPAYTAESWAAQGRWGEVSGRRRTHYCGAYWGYGFHEDGAASGARAAEAVLGAPVPAGAPG
ncbi:MAG TPA: FAD-dependent oxidoreductase [Solirubrobacterales bacterium]|nr:FAD-dependent oxidoreductase [Solirubrobacterales bacterium]